jgi:hypothetical protein
MRSFRRRYGSGFNGGGAQGFSPSW